MVFLKSKARTLPANSSYSRSLLENLKVQELSSYDSAILLVSGSDSIFVHSVILKTASNLINALLSESCDCQSNLCIILPSSPSLTLNSLVNLLYTGCVSNLSEDQAKDVSILSKLIGIEMEIRMVGLSDTTEIDLVDKGIDVNEPNKLRATLLNVVTNIKDKKSDFDVELCFPKSRVKRLESGNKTREFYGFKKRVQREYNEHLVGQFMGPYDQHETLNLGIQLPDTDINYQSYTEFCHDGGKCFEFCVKSYEKYEDLDKIRAYQIRAAIEEFDGSSNDDSENSKKYYTCQARKCKIPCPCPQCNSSEDQCKEHNLQHPALFDDEKHVLSIRSSRSFCLDESFFENSYLIRYSGIPLECRKCSQDLLLHHSYHFEFHETCRFCKLTFYKLKALTKEEHLRLEKREVHYYKTVCPFCNKRFREAFDVKKHIEFKHQHGKVLFACDYCDKGFQSNQAKEYHEKLKHVESEDSFSCDICHKTFPMLVNLNSHKKYVHSDVQKWSCENCGTKFKQKRDLRAHLLKIHEINQRTEDYMENSENKVFICKKCGTNFQYQKNLNAHIKVNHTESIQPFQCEECPLKFKHKTTLMNHQRVKHDQSKQKYVCPVCQQEFTAKKNMKRHEKKH